jgi:DNA invertase Pin-like site-specific DNA recombinase
MASVIQTKTSDKVKRAGIYVRVASKPQVGDSASKQTAAARQFAIDLGMIVQGEYVDCPVSGQRPVASRAGWRRRLDDVGRGDLDAIVVTSFHQLSRSATLRRDAYKFLHDRNVDVISVSEPADALRVSIAEIELPDRRTWSESD